jgi:hypothetical protein
MESEVAGGPNSAILPQVTNDLATRMAPLNERGRSSYEEKHRSSS